MFFGRNFTLAKGTIQVRSGVMWGALKSKHTSVFIDWAGHLPLLFLLTLTLTVSSSSHLSTQFWHDIFAYVHHKLPCYLLTLLPIWWVFWFSPEGIAVNVFTEIHLLVHLLSANAEPLSAATTSSAVGVKGEDISAFSQCTHC